MQSLMLHRSKSAQKQNALLSELPFCFLDRVGLQETVEFRRFVSPAPSKLSNSTVPVLVVSQTTGNFQSFSLTIQPVSVANEYFGRSVSGSGQLTARQARESLVDRGLGHAQSRCVHKILFAKDKKG